MKKRITCLGLVAVLAVSMMGCSGGHEKQVVELEVETNTEPQSFSVNVSAELDGDFQIPDPAKTDGVAEVFLHQCAYKAGESNRYCTERENEPKYDLSFLGLKKKVYVTNYAIGNITGSGACLVLAVDKGKKTWDHYAYLVVLDYKNKKAIWQKRMSFPEMGLRTS